ncbi:MAG: hypothetical protein ABEK16_02585 [Candidatus Nanohalobium sp.]
MATPILKRRLNPLLLISTVAALSLLAGVSVIYQDRVSSKVGEIEKLNQNISESMERIRTLENKTRNLKNTTENLNSTISTLRKKLERKESLIENKTQRISDLRSQLDQQRRALNQSDKINDLNSSLSFVCALYSGDSDTVKQECNQWGHKVNLDEG